jgi:hypothetical protein
MNGSINPIDCKETIGGEAHAHAATSEARVVVMSLEDPSID